MTTNTLLVVDDDAQFRDLVGKLLAEKGHKVVMAATGKDATSAMREHKPALVIVDGLLPDTDGVRWIASRRANGDRTPVVFVSAFWKDLSSYQKLTRDLGVSLVLHKPIVAAAFAGQIDGVLQKLAPPAPPAPSAPAPAPPAPAPAPMVEDLGLHDELEAMFAAYARDLPRKVGSLRAAADRARRRPQDADAISVARGEAHKLCGTAGSYGFPRVGDAARVIEELMVRAQYGRMPSELEWVSASRGLEESMATSAPGARPGPAHADTAHGSRVLVVDDDPAFLDMVVALGKERALQVIPARTAADALRLATESPPDVAVIDVRLGDDPMSSFELAGRLRAVPGCEAVPLAFVSGEGKLADRVSAAHAGASLYLCKPLDADGLAAAVHQLTASARARRPRVLVVDDDPDAAQLLATMLTDDGMQVTALRDASRILETLDEVTPDVLLLDARMPEVSGFDVCRMIRAMPRWQDLVILFVTAESAVDQRVAAFQVGADDYLSKPIVKEELIARVRVRVERTRLLRDRLDRDSLTGLHVRRTFLEQLSARLSEVRRRKRPLSIALLDVDHFKKVNDLHGHMAGDRVLAAFGKLLARRFRAEDLRARWGGEEFVLAFADEQPHTVAAILERVLVEFAKLEFRGDGGESFHVTFSAGVAGRPGDGEGAHELIACADRRLYAAKAAGRNCIIHEEEHVPESRSAAVF